MSLRQLTLALGLVAALSACGPESAVERTPQPGAGANTASTSTDPAEFVPGQPLDERPCDPRPEPEVVAPAGLVTPPGTVLVLQYPSRGGFNLQGWVPLDAAGVLDWYKANVGVVDVDLSTDWEVEAGFKRSRRDQWRGFHAQTACADGSDIYFWVPAKA